MFAAPEGAGHRARTTPSSPPINPIGRGHDGPRRQAVAGARPRAPVGLADRRGEAAVLAHGRGVRRVPEPRRPRASGACSTTSSRAGELDNTIDRRSSPTTARRARAARTDRSTRTSSSTASRTRSRRTCKYLDELGGTRTYNHYPTGWAWAFNTPFKMWKRYSNYEGGTADPLIMSWPAGIKARGELRNQYCHAIDIVPTIYDALGVEPPETISGYTQTPLEGVSMRRQLRRRRRADAGKQTQFYSMLGTRAIWHEGWKASPPHPPRRTPGRLPRAATGSCIDTDVDPSECHDLAAEQPDKLQELIEPVVGGGRQRTARSRWTIARRGRDPHDRAAPARASRATATSTTRAAPRCRSRSRRNIRNRSYTIARRGRHRRRRMRRRALLAGLALRRPRPLHQGRQAQVRLQLGRRARADDRVGPSRSRPGTSMLSASFEREGDDHADAGNAARSTSATRRSARAGSGPSPAKFAHRAATGLMIGRAQRRAGDRRLRRATRRRPFTGGTIERVVVDVSGEPYIDLAQEAPRWRSRSNEARTSDHRGLARHGPTQAAIVDFVRA